MHWCKNRKPGLMETTQMKMLFPALAASLSLAACMSPAPPTISDRDVSRALAEASRVSRLPQTRLADLPTGAVTYTGKVGASVGGDLQGSLLGDMSMRVGFQDNAVRGSVNNINLVDRNGRPDQALGGNLAINGFQAQGDILATAAGRVTGVQPNGSAFASDVTLNMQGGVRDDRSRGDAVFGTVTGRGVGDLGFLVDGVFYGTR
jgi:hypothetical protein